MGVVQRDTDRLALVLEDEDVGDLGAGAQLGIAVRPDVDEVRHLLHRQIGEGGSVVAREHHDLGRTGRGLDGVEVVPCHVRLGRVTAQRRPAVVEDGDVVRPARDLRRARRISGRAQRAEVGRRQEGAVLAGRREDDPLAARGSRRAPSRGLVPGEQQQRAAVVELHPLDVHPLGRCGLQGSDAARPGFSHGPGP
jgi:hypothetical protein